MTEGDALLMAIDDVRSDAGVEDDGAIQDVIFGDAPYSFRRLSTERLAALYRWRKANPDPRELAVKMFQLSACDEDGELLYAYDRDTVAALPDGLLSAAQKLLLAFNGLA